MVAALIADGFRNYLRSKNKGSKKQKVRHNNHDNLLGMLLGVAFEY